jgi:hypothetical protein
MIVSLKKICYELAVCIMLVTAFGNCIAQQSLFGIRLQDANGHALLINGPTAGFSANYNFRFPPASTGTGSILYTSDAVGQLGWLAAGSNGQVLTLSGGIPSWVTPASGTVTSVGLSMPAMFTVTNSPVTASGTLTTTLATQSANLVFAGPSTGAAIAPTFRSLVAADIPNLDASKITTGILPVAQGGTGASTLTAHGVVVGNGTSAVNVTTSGTAGQILESGGSGADPSWQSAALGTYGDGSDGSLTYDGTTTILGVVPAANVYTLNRDIFPSSMTVNAGITIIANGTRIFCTGILDNNGTIHNNGNNAANNVAGVATSAINVLGIGQAGGAGGNNGAGGATAATANAGGGSGGVGGISGAGQSAGTVGGAVAPVQARGGSKVFHSFSSASTGVLLFGAASPVLFTGGSGGSGGGGANANSGGGGGGGGGVLLINAWKIDNTGGTISANGGNGGNGTGTNGGSGGGGGGGLVLLIYHSFLGNAATATKGNAGTVKTGTGVLGSAGSDGTVVSIQN